MASRRRSPIRRAALGLSLLAGLGAASGAWATEGGASFYLLGAGGPGAAVMPPLKGVFFDNQIYAYSANAGGGKTFQVGGNVVANLHANVTADFATVLWVPTTNLLGGTLAVGGVLPVGSASADVSAVLSGPRGRQISRSLSDSTFAVGDPIATAVLGWKTGRFSTQVSDGLNIPIGQYRDGALANLSFHRWIDDLSFAGTWNDAPSGWDLSAKAGVTFNGTGIATDYYSGTEFHLEGSVEKMLSPAWSAGVQAYWFHQLANDGGPGDTLGPFKGEVTGVGGSAAYHFAFSKTMPATLRLRVMTEFDAKNRAPGTSAVFDLSFPLSLQLPKGG